jgi:anti-anti-sigma factor
LRVPEGGLYLEVQRSTDSVVVVLAGEIDLATVADLESVLDHLPVTTDILLDCANVGYMGARGLHLLLCQSQRMRPHMIRIRHPSPLVRRLLEVTRLEAFLAQLPPDATPSSEGDREPVRRDDHAVGGVRSVTVSRSSHTRRGRDHGSSPGWAATRRRRRCS